MLVNMPLQLDNFNFMFVILLIINETCFIYEFYISSGFFKNTFLKR